jgi:glycerol uptake facilitator-like aquaporin
MRLLPAEGFGTFCLVFAGTGAIVVDDVSGGVVSHVGIALTFGLVVLAMIGCRCIREDGSCTGAVQACPPPTTTP